VSPDTALEWLAWATRRSANEVLALGLEHDQLVKLGAWLSENGLLNPPTRAPLKQAEFVCQCGCGKKFTATYRTSRPKYLSSAHKARAYRARKRAEEAKQAQRSALAGLVPNGNGRGFRVARA